MLHLDDHSSPCLSSLPGAIITVSRRASPCLGISPRFVPLTKGIHLADPTIINGIVRDCQAKADVDAARAVSPVKEGVWNGRVSGDYSFSAAMSGIVAAYDTDEPLHSSAILIVPLRDLLHVFSRQIRQQPGQMDANVLLGFTSRFPWKADRTKESPRFQNRSSGVGGLANRVAGVSPAPTRHT